MDRDPRAYTPKHLADKILRSKSVLEGECKQVTVLFADVKGSMELAEQVDPEEWHRILDRFFRILADGVHRFEGTINQYTGDGIMALFGAPIAHEDHAQRACYATLHLRDELRRYAEELKRTRGLNFSVRMGLNSGDVVVGKIGDDLRMDYTAQGQTVGLAQRVEQLASAESAYLTNHTARLVEGFFRLRDLGEFALKGISAPLRLHELQGTGRLRTRLDRSRSRGFSRFVGRTDEMTTLEAALHRALEGSGQVVGVAGQAGVGKSRLCFEFLERCRAQGIRVLEGHCPAHGKSIPFLPVLEIFRAYFGIRDQDSAEEARRKIAGTLVLLDEAFQETLPLVFDFLGVADPAQHVPRADPEARQRRLFSFLRRVVQARSEREPAVILFDDLQWVDGGSEALLTELVEIANRTRTLVLVNFRPEYHAPWMQKSYYQQLSLQPLGRDAIAELLGALLGSDSSLEGLAPLVRERTDGNPFFIEEVIRSLVESGSLDGAPGAYRLARRIEELEVPASVQALLAGRIDRLSEQEKHVLQTASVIGRVFPEPVLRRIIELPEADLSEALTRLEDGELVYAETLYPEAEYAFRHPLTQEVAYRSQLAEPRARLHGAVAEALEELAPEKLDERSGLLSHHWEAAGEPLRAARWSARAADWAGRANSGEAFRHWRRVRSLLAEWPACDEKDALLLGACGGILDLGWRVGVLEDELASTYAEGRAIAERRGDLRSLAMLTGAYGATRGMGGALDEWLMCEEEAVHLADQSADPGLRAALRIRLAYAMMLGADDYPGALRRIDEGLALCQGDVGMGRDVMGFSPYLGLLSGRTGALTEVGRLSEGREEAERAIRIAEEHGEPEALSFVVGWATGNATARGEGHEARAYGRRSLEFGEKLQTAFALTWGHFNTGDACLTSEEWNAAIAHFESALSLIRSHNTVREAEGNVLAGLAEARLGHDEFEPAQRTAEEAVAVAREGGYRFAERVAQLTLARVLLRTEGASAKERIEAALARARALLDASGSEVQRPSIHEARARLARLLGEEVAYERELRQAHRLFIEMGATGHVARVARELND